MAGHLIVTLEGDSLQSLVVSQDTEHFDSLELYSGDDVKI